MVKIGHASIGESGARYQKAGDQTGREVCTRDWYNKGWTHVFRPKESALAEKLAHGMEQVCANDNIGYSQTARTSMLPYARAVDYDYSRIKTPCEVDCSSLIGILCKGVGLNVSENIWTGNEALALMHTGHFEMYTTSDYTRSPEKLKRGDILLSEGHTAMVLSNGGAVDNGGAVTVEYAESFDKKKSGRYLVRVNTFLSLRTGASINRKEIKKLVNDDCVTCYGYYTGNWYLVECKDGTTGFVYSEYLRRI